MWLGHATSMMKMVLLNRNGGGAPLDDLKVNDSQDGTGTNDVEIAEIKSRDDNDDLKVKDGAETNDVEMAETIKRSHSRAPPDLLSPLPSNYQQNGQIVKLSFLPRIVQ